MLRFKKNNALDFPDLEETTLGEVCNKIGDGLHSAPAYDADGEYYFINGNNLKDGVIIITPDTKKVSKETFKKNDKGLDDHTILLSINGTIGNLAYYKNENVMLGKSAAYLKIKESVDKEYIYQLLQTRKVKISFLLSLTGTTIKNLGLEAINKTHIFIPVLEEQHKIADFLSSVDNIIQVQQEEIFTLEEQKKGVMQKLFNRKVKFKADNGSEYPAWEEKQLENIAIIKMGQSPDSSSYNEECIGLPLIQGNADISGRVSAPQRHTSKPTKECNIGDIIMTVRAPVGFVGKSIHHACIGRGVCAISSKISTEYLFQFLISVEDSWKRIEQGSTFTAIGGDEVKKLMVFIPCVEEQEKIADCLLAYDDAIQIKKDKLEVWKDIKKGLLQQMFV